MAAESVLLVLLRFDREHVCVLGMCPLPPFLSCAS